MSDRDGIAVMGLIAGQGRLPVLAARSMRAAGLRVACVGLAHQYDADLPAACDDFAEAGVIRIGRWIRLLRRFGARQTVMLGGVKKSRVYEPWRWFRQLPDWRAIRLWYGVLRHDRRTAALLAAVADELAGQGITLIDSTTYLREYLADEGVMTRAQPTAEQLADIDFAWPLLTQLNSLDIGQSIAVREREVIAIEAIEGTDAMIRRAGELCRRGGWTLAKAARRDHDMRFDVPTVGPQTIENLHAAKARCLVVQAGKVILADRPRMIELADRHGIAILGRTLA